MDLVSAFKDYIQGLNDIQVTRYTQLTSSCIIVFEHLITFDEEVELIWKSTWSLGKVLFLLNRYYSLAAFIFNNYALFSPALNDTLYALTYSGIFPKLFTSLAYLISHSCLRFFQWQGWTGLLGCMLAEGILQIRIYALYSLNKRILALMLTFFVLSLISSAYVMITVLSSVTASAFPIPGGKFCIVKGVPRHFYAFWIPMLAFETLLCILAIIQGVQTYKSQGSLFRRGRQLVGILVRDSLMYFLVICSTYLTCLLVWAVAPVNLLGVPIGFSLAMSCVLANRVVLNVREINRDLNLSKQPLRTSQKGDEDHFGPCNSSFCSPGELTTFELQRLRTMRAEKCWSEITEYLPQSPNSF